MEKKRVKGEVRRHYAPRISSDNKVRICLKCDKSFKSSGPGNRFCTKCATLNRAAKTKSKYSLVRVEVED